MKLHYSIYSVPITYNVREGETKLESLKDGLKILFTFFRHLSWSPLKANVDKKKIEQQVAFNQKSTLLEVQEIRVHEEVLVSSRMLAREE